MRKVLDAGYPHHVSEIQGEDIHTVEPALNECVISATFAPAEFHVRPETVTAGLVAFLQSRGVRVHEHAPVSAFERSSRGEWDLRAGDIEICADAVIIAAGTHSTSLLRSLGVRIRLEPAKGYSVTTAGAGTAPRHALYLPDAKVGISPFADELRIAGTLELGRWDLTLNRHRIDAMVDAACSYLHDWRPSVLRTDWAGLRPVTSDGLPIIGEVPGFPGIYLATGHSMLGMTLAPATAAALAPFVLDGVIADELRPFRLVR
jgi:D-amino-acid dehydrogenase